uniref:Ubiquitin-like protease family profile domain-containing protein n=1 Tax=Eptatretus burgeri TaxID=7764 RepID=A0A8C4PYB7_EPTBU
MKIYTVKFWSTANILQLNPEIFLLPPSRLFIYPPPPNKGGIGVSTDDLLCLEPGEFLNDIIIDFYLKYLVMEKLGKKDAERVHIFSTFFYKRLLQTERVVPEHLASLTPSQRRHHRVRTWTRKVDIFQKDFIFIPINEEHHWFLAVICFPGLSQPLWEVNPNYHGTPPPSLHKSDGDIVILDTRSLCMSEADRGQPDKNGTAHPGKEEVAEGRALHGEEDKERCAQPIEERRLQLVEKKSSVQPVEQSGVQPVEMFDCFFVNTSCIVYFARYLEEEWRARHSGERGYSQQTMPGFSPRVPQQNNFSDCGVFLLHYAEAFFQHPICSFQLPMQLESWFLSSTVGRQKREEIRQLMMRLQQEQQGNKPVFGWGTDGDCNARKHSLKRTEILLTSSSPRPFSFQVYLT